MDKNDLYIYDLMTFRDAFIPNFNLFKQSFITQTQSLIEKIIIFPITFPRAFLRLRYKYKFDIWHFLHLFIHEVLINLRNTFFDIREVICHRIRGHKVVKAKEMGKLISEAFEYPKSYTNNFKKIIKFIPVNYNSFFKNKLIGFIDVVKKCEKRKD